MNKLKEKVVAYNVEVRQALQTMYDAMNSGQKKQIIKKTAVIALFKRYGIEV